MLKRVLYRFTLPPEDLDQYPEELKARRDTAEALRRERQAFIDALVGIGILPNRSPYSSHREQRRF